MLMYSCLEPLACRAMAKLGFIPRSMIDPWKGGDYIYIAWKARQAINVRELLEG